MGQKMQTQTKRRRRIRGRLSSRRHPQGRQRGAAQCGDARLRRVPLHACRRRAPGVPCRWLLHSTHKHREDAWRVRLVVPLSRDVTVDEYGAVARRVAERIGFSGIDRSTFEPVRLMFWPSRSTDAPLAARRGARRDDARCRRGAGQLCRLARPERAWPMLPEEADALRLFSPSPLPSRNAGDRPQGGGAHLCPRCCIPGQRAEDPREKRGLVRHVLPLLHRRRGDSGIYPRGGLHTRAARGVTRMWAAPRSAAPWSSTAGGSLLVPRHRPRCAASCSTPGTW